MRDIDSDIECQTSRFNIRKIKTQLSNLIKKLYYSV